MTQWRFHIDVGGTFTDCIAITPQGETKTHKVLSSAAYKGRVGIINNHIVAIQSSSHFPENFFSGFSLSILDPDTHRPIFQGRVTSSNADGTLQLAAPVIDLEHKPWTFELQSSEPAPICGIRYLMGLGTNDQIGNVSIKLGTTRGTNALLERKGERTALITTMGFRDVLQISYQNRPRLFALNIKKHLPLCEQVAEISGRLDARGRVLIPLNETEIRATLKKVFSSGIRSLAVCLLHAHKNSVHERKVASIASEIGFTHVSLSSEVVNLQKIVTRADTTVVDAYLTPVIKDYIQCIKRAAPDAQVKMMTSAGGLVSAEHFIGKDSILSGPAGGVIGVGYVAQKTGLEKAIGFDMGGTSTDICRFDRIPELRYEMEINDPRTDAGSRIVAPMLAIETVAAGGGSVCAFDGLRLTVGPESAGADPGPACYGKSGPLTITDCNLYLGRIAADSFSFPLDSSATVQRLQGIQKLMHAAGFSLDLPAIALGFLKVAASNMAQPVLKISMHRGYDIREYGLISFGGAGAQHACQVADALGIKKIIQHPMASLLSAFGIGAADAKKQEARDFGQTLSQVNIDAADALFIELESKITEAFEREGEAKTSAIVFIRSLDLRYRGQDSLINVPLDSFIQTSAQIKSLFEDRHRQTYGFVFSDRQIEIRNLRVEGVIRLTEVPQPVERTARPVNKQPEHTVNMWFDDGNMNAGVYQRAALVPGDQIIGPAMITDAMTTLVITPGWRAEALPEGVVELTAINHTHDIKNEASAPDPISTTLFSNMFTSVAEQMGAVLQRTALSVNVKERLDFSCAVFSADGALIVNAPHIPVHLGSMGDTVRAIMRHAGNDLKDGDVYVTNDPYAGGSHLPDVSVITPVFSSQGKLLFFTGNRAHHSEIGGITPGSMPPGSKNLAEEGVLIRNFRLVRSGKSEEASLRKLLNEAPFPSRQVDDNIADINAQIAANEIGKKQLLDLARRYGEDTLIDYARHIREGARSLMTEALRQYTSARSFQDALDDGSIIKLTIKPAHGIPGKSVVFDFTGSAPINCGNNNANIAIVKAAVLYSLRCLLNRDIPLNEGVLDPVEFIIPAPSILSPCTDDQLKDPTQLPAVTAGNVETSQRIVDVVLGALDLAAASQGTMNNVIFGKPSKEGVPGFGYYETICGGAGAGPDFHGASAVHTHMTNTRITDPEVLEERFPVRLRRFEIRTASGGRGAYRGGDGVVREIEFLEDLELSVISNRRAKAPYGLHGGANGACGENRLKRNGSADFELQPGSFHTRVRPGDIFQIATPGGGGYGDG